MQVSQKALERGKKFLATVRSNEQHRILNQIKHADSALELAKGMLVAVDKSYMVTDAQLVIDRAIDLGAPKEETDALIDFMRAKHRELNDIEWKADVNKAQQLWDGARPELEKAGLVTEWLKPDTPYKARCYKGRVVRIRFVYPGASREHMNAMYKPSARSKNEYFAFDVPRMHREEAKSARIQIERIKYWEIKPVKTIF